MPHEYYPGPFSGTGIEDIWCWGHEKKLADCGFSEWKTGVICEEGLAALRCGKWLGLIPEHRDKNSSMCRFM